MIRVVLPAHLRALARSNDAIALEVAEPATVATVLDALEARHPVLRGTIRDHGTRARRPMVRFFVAGEDWSLDSPDRPLPRALIDGEEPFLIVGAIAGG